MASRAQGIGSSPSDPDAGQHTVMQRRNKIASAGVSFQHRLSVYSAGNDFEMNGNPPACILPGSPGFNRLAFYIIYPS